MILQGLGDDFQQTVTVFNDTTSSVINTIEIDEIGSTAQQRPNKIIGFTLSSNSIIYLRDSDSAFRGTFYIHLTKF